MAGPGPWAPLREPLGGGYGGGPWLWPLGGGYGGGPWLWPLGGGYGGGPWLLAAGPLGRRSRSRPGPLGRRSGAGAWSPVSRSGPGAVVAGQEPAGPPAAIIATPTTANTIAAAWDRVIRSPRIVAARRTVTTV